MLRCPLSHTVLYSKLYEAGQCGGNASDMVPKGTRFESTGILSESFPQINSADRAGKTHSTRVMSHCARFDFWRCRQTSPYAD
jgi:hypothetical protein